MEQEKIKEIKKFLEESACMYGNMQKQALTLINELESENERLLNEKWDKEDDLDNYHIENQELKDCIAELEKGTKR